MGVNRLVAVHIDEETLGASGPDAEHERRVAIFDLIEENTFGVIGEDRGPLRQNRPSVASRVMLQVTIDAACYAASIAG